MRLLFEGGFYYKLRCCSCGFYSRAATNNVFTVYLTIFLVSKHSSSSQSIQLVQLAIPEIKFSVWARFLARSARAKLGSAQLTKLKIWKSSAQLSSPFERGQLSSARSLAKNFRLVSPLISVLRQDLRVYNASCARMYFMYQVRRTDIFLDTYYKIECMYSLMYLI